MPNDPIGPIAAAAAALELEEEEAPVAVPLEDPDSSVAEEEEAPVAVPLEDPDSPVAEEPESEVDEELVVVTVAFPGTVAIRLMVDDSVVLGDELETEDSVLVVTTPVSSVEVDVGSGTVAVAVGTVAVVVATAEGLEVEHVWPSLMAEQNDDAAGRTESARGSARLI